MIAFCAWASGAGRQPPEIRGDYLEARSNHVFGCYCEWSGEAVTGGREAILAWEFKAGDFRGVSLAGVKAVAVIVAPATLSAGYAPRDSMLFFDNAVSEEQQRAALALLRERYGGLLGQVVGTRAMPIDFRRDEEGARLRAGDLVDVSLRRARLPDDAMKGAILWYEPFITLKESTLGATVKYSYRGEDFGLQWTVSDAGITGYYGSFLLAPP